MGVRGPPGAWALGPGPCCVAAAASNLYGRGVLVALAAGSTAASPGGGPLAPPTAPTTESRVAPRSPPCERTGRCAPPSWKRRWRVIVRRHAPVAPRVGRRLLGDGGADRRCMAPVWRPDASSMPHALTTHTTFRRDDYHAGLRPRGAKSPRRRQAVRASGAYTVMVTLHKHAVLEMQEWLSTEAREDFRALAQ